MTETYAMEFQCRNCATWFLKELPKGTEAQGRGGRCPYCDNQDSFVRPFQTRRPTTLEFNDGRFIPVAMGLLLKENRR